MEKILKLEKIKKARHYFIIIPLFCERHPDKLSLVLKNYAEASSNLVRLIALCYLPVESFKLEQLINSIYWLDRYGVTQNINVSCKQLEKLTNDGNKIVRAAAKANLENKQKANL